ncbi:MAG: hypothetical protein GY838_13275 [bacterium]|nr:hypothetical protein [bacterium]
MPNMKIKRPMIVAGVDPGKTSGWGIHCEDLHRDFARGYTVPHDWHWGQCSGVDGAMIQAEISSILDMVAAFYAADWTNGDESSGEPKLVLRGTTERGEWLAFPEMYFYVEDQFVIDDQKVAKPERLAKQRDALGVATSKGRWMAIAETFGFSTHQVMPSTWRRTQLGKGWGSAPREKAKAQAVLAANSIWGLGIKRSQDHGAEARFIAEYGWVEQQQTRRMTRAIQ